MGGLGLCTRLRLIMHTTTAHGTRHTQAAHPPALWGLADAGRARPADRSVSGAFPLGSIGHAMARRRAPSRLASPRDCLTNGIQQHLHTLTHTHPVGWATRLADMYQRKADVIVRGFSGYNTAWLLKMLPDLFLRLFRRRPPALVTIWLGAGGLVGIDRTIGEAGGGGWLGT